MSAATNCVFYIEEKAHFVAAPGIILYTQHIE